MQLLKKSAASNPLEADESGTPQGFRDKLDPRNWGSFSVSRVFAGPAMDRGSSYHQTRGRHAIPSLVEGGRHAGHTRVKYRGHNLRLHLLTRDFFITMINLKTRTIMLLVIAIYLTCFFLWSIPYYLIVRYYPGCIYGATTYVEAWIFAAITMTTIGYGNTGPQQCWAASWLIVCTAIFNVLLEAVTLGIIFSRISHPKQRGRSIFISSKAIIARRDGVLKFMFRIADIRNTQVVEPKVRAFLYTWGEGRTTAEGEKIPVRCEELDIGYIDGMLILPLIIEHTIDERSPMCGHTHDSLVALSAEIVVTFEGTTEFGNPFMARRSYLPGDLHWGYQFSPIIQRPMGDNDEAQYTINLELFHDVEPQAGLPPLPPSQLSQLVVNRAKRTVPYPLLGENTLVLSDILCLAPDKKGRMCLFARAADTYPNQMLEITARMYLYRWAPPDSLSDPSQPTFTQEPLYCGYKDGTDRLFLRLPTEVAHVITDDSPIAHWRRPEGVLEDADAEVVVVINSYLHLNGQNRMRQRTYSVGHHVRYGFRFLPIVRHPSQSRDHKPRVRWNRFHDVVPVSDMEQHMAHWVAYDTEHLAGRAPESHGAYRSQAARDAGFDGESSTLHSPGLSARPSPRLSSLPSPRPSVEGGAGSSAGAPAEAVAAEGAPAAAGVGAAARAAAQQWYDERNDYTVLPMDLQRYAATTEEMDHTLPKLTLPKHSPIPDFAAAAAAVSGAALAGAAGGMAPRSSSPPKSRQGDGVEGKGASWKRLLARHSQRVDDQEAGSSEAEPVWRRIWRQRQAAAEEAAPEERFTVLFPEVVNYAATTTDAADSLPHPAALHPTLPGPDRFRAPTDDELAAQAANDYTVLPVDLHRYAATMLGEGDTVMPSQHMPPFRPLLPPRSRFNLTPGEEGAAPASERAATGAQGRDTAVSEAVAVEGEEEASRRQGEGSQRRAGNGVEAAAAAAGEAEATAADEAENGTQEAQGAAARLERQQQQEEQGGLDGEGRRPAEVELGQGPGWAEAAAAAAAEEPQEEEGTELAAGRHQEQPGGEGREDAEAGSSDQISNIGSESSGAGEEVGKSRRAGEQRPASPTLDESQLLPPETFDMEQEHSGPIHFTKQESWRRDRALSNVFGVPSADALQPTIKEEDGEGEKEAGQGQGAK